MLQQFKDNSVLQTPGKKIQTFIYKEQMGNPKKLKVLSLVQIDSCHVF